MRKSVTVVIAANGERRNITIEPGTSANDILRSLGLQGYALSKDGSSATFFEGGKNVYPEVDDGQDVWASADPRNVHARLPAPSPFPQ